MIDFLASLFTWPQPIRFPFGDGGLYSYKRQSVLIKSSVAEIDKNNNIGWQQMNCRLDVFRIMGLGRSNTEIGGSNPTRSMGFCPRLSLLCPLQSVKSLHLNGAPGRTYKLVDWSHNLALYSSAKLEKLRWRTSKRETYASSWMNVLKEALFFACNISAYSLLLYEFARIRTVSTNSDRCNYEPRNFYFYYRMAFAKYISHLELILGPVRRSAAAEEMWQFFTPGALIYRGR
jgi:hypothetical protein